MYLMASMSLEHAMRGGEAFNVMSIDDDELRTRLFLGIPVLYTFDIGTRFP